MALKLRKSNVAQPAPECPLTACMTLLGGAWTPNVIWFLSGGPRRFGELRRDIPRISAKVLAARLKILEEKGVVHREVIPTSPPSVEYRLTDLGAVAVDQDRQRLGTPPVPAADLARRTTSACARHGADTSASPAGGRTAGNRGAARCRTPIVIHRSLPRQAVEVRLGS